jgi:uncharacterized protein (DUF1501 family)
MMSRRRFLGGAGVLPFTAALSAIEGRALAEANDYRALVVLYLNGGNDGNNVLVPTDGAYGDYQAARQNLTLPRTDLVALSGTAAGHTFGVHPAFRPLVPLYEQGRLAFIANVGPLAEPCTAAQVLAGVARVPPFLFSHSDQTAFVQGWAGANDASGWAGRGLERLPTPLRHRFAGVTSGTQRTLVLGRRASASFVDPDGGNWWGLGDLSRPHETGPRALLDMAQWRFTNPYEAEYARTYASAIDDSVLLARARIAPAPEVDFGSNEGVARGLRTFGSLMPYFKAQGLKRQVFLQSWGAFDTHARQRGGDAATQDAQLATVAKALAGFDRLVRRGGLDGNVVTLVMTEFNRTLRPGSGGGSEHAWGNHWWVLGGPVAGGTVIGTFPKLVLGGPDDGDPGKNGRFVPTLSSDQVGATLMQWLGLAPASFVGVFPALANFSTRTAPLLHP